MGCHHATATLAGFKIDCRRRYQKKMQLRWNQARPDEPLEGKKQNPTPSMGPGAGSRKTFPTQVEGEKCS